MPRKIIKRSILLPKIREARRTILKSAFSGESEVYELKTYEFFTIAILYQLNASHVFFFIEMAIKYGAISLTILYILLTAVLGVPLFLLFTFMSSYSRKNYLAFWKCVPLFEGIGYSLVVMRLAIEMQNSTIASFSLLLLFKFLSGSMKAAITSCQNATVKCAPMYPTENVTYECEPGTSIPTATQYFIFNTRNTDSVTVMENINTQWLITMTVTWLLIFLLSLQGLRYIKRATISFVLLCLSLMFFIGSFALSNVPWSTIKKVKLVAWTEGSAILTFNFWVDVILHSSEMNVLAIVIWLGTLKPKNLHPKYAAVIITPLKLVAFICILCTAACLTKETVVHYKYTDINCFHMTVAIMLPYPNSKVSNFFSNSIRNILGWTVATLTYWWTIFKMQLNSTGSLMFSMVPDVMLRTKVYNLYIPLWYFCLFICSASTPLYSLIAMIDAILEKFKTLRKYRLYLIICSCLVSFFGSLTFMGKRGSIVDVIWKRCVVPLWSASMLLLVTLALFFVYSTRAVIDDYLFTYGCTPERYWTTTWKTTPIFAILVFILVLHNDYTNNLCTANATRAVATHAMFLLGLLPVIATLLITCFKHIKGNTLHLLARPGDEWGPYGEEVKIEKSLFFPQRDIKYRSEKLKCSHSCLVRNNADFLNKSIEHQRKLVILEEEYLFHKAS